MYYVHVRLLHEQNIAHTLLETFEHSTVKMFSGEKIGFRVYESTGNMLVENPVISLRENVKIEPMIL